MKIYTQRTHNTHMHTQAQARTHTHARISCMHTVHVLCVCVHVCYWMLCACACAHALVDMCICACFVCVWCVNFDSTICQTLSSPNIKLTKHLRYTVCVVSCNHWDYYIFVVLALKDKTSLIQSIMYIFY